MSSGGSLIGGDTEVALGSTGGVDISLTGSATPSVAVGFIFFSATGVATAFADSGASVVVTDLGSLTFVLLDTEAARGGGLVVAVADSLCLPLFDTLPELCWA